jgi:hypothetical protein
MSVSLRRVAEGMMVVYEIWRLKMENQTKNKMKPCPYCKGFPHTLEFVELNTLNFENAIAVECLSCGCRGMAADSVDGEDMAISLWNDLYAG